MAFVDARSEHPDQPQNLSFHRSLVHSSSSERKDRDKTEGHVGTYPACTCCRYGSRRLILVNTEGKVTSIHRSVLNRLTFGVVENFSLTNRRIIWRVAIGEQNNTNVLSISEDFDYIFIWQKVSRVVCEGTDFAETEGLLRHSC